MTNLNEVAEARVKQMLAKSEGTVQATVTRLLNEGKIAKDFISETGTNRRLNQKPVMEFHANGTVKMEISGQGEYEIHPHAVSQLASKLNIPQAYLRDLATGNEWEKQLAVRILNDHSGWSERDRVLIRAVGQQIRGVLSDHYRRLNSLDIITGFMDELQKQGAVLSDGRMDDTRVWFESIYPQPIQFETAKNGVVVMFFGARLMNSDYGDSALELRSFLLQGICLNGAVRESILRQVHLGGRLPDDIQFSERTYKYDTLATAGAIRDITKNLYSRETFLKRGAEILEASGQEVNIEKELKALSAGRIGKGESEKIGEILMANRPDDGVQGEATLWKLVQGITAYSRTAEPRRRLDLQEIAGSLMDRVKVKDGIKFNQN